MRAFRSSLWKGHFNRKPRGIDIAINRSVHAPIAETELENHWTAHTDLQLP